MSKPYFQLFRIVVLLAIAIPQQALSLNKNHQSQALKIVEKGEQYLFNAPDSAITNLSKALSLLESDQSTDAATIRGDIYKKLGIANTIKSRQQQAIAFFKKAIAENNKTKDTNAIAANINNIGIAQRDIGQYDEALSNFLKSLRISEKSNNLRMQSIATNNIATLFSMQQDFAKAIKWQKQSLKISIAINDKPFIAKSYMNLGSYYIGDKKNLMAGLNYQKKAIPIFEELKDYPCLAIAYNNIGDILHLKKLYEQSDINFKKALNYAEIVDDKIKQSTINSELALLHLDMYKENLGNKELTSARNYAQIALKAAQESGGKKEETTAFGLLAQIYAELKDFGKAYAYSKREHEIKDSLFTQEKSEFISKTETKFNVEKKQKEIDLLEKDKAIRIAQAKQRNTFIASSLVCIILLLAFTIIICQKLRTSRKQKQIIEEQKSQVEQQNEILNEKNEEIITQKEQIEKHQEVILDSINYSRRIQTAILPTFPDVDRIKSHFIFYRPKNIVSGDFYWFSRTAEKTVIAVADCTGHGVPGGFLSMLGMAFLSEIVTREKHNDAALILERLRKRMINALQQENEHDANKDGMDIALCVYDSSTSEVQFAGANNSLYVIQGDGQLQTVQGERQPASIFPRMRPFTNHTIKIETGDTLYMSTDGYRDQFSENKKKFGSGQLKQMLERISPMPMPEQKVEIEKALEQWQGNTKQMDDICIVGIRF